ncbi:hypothetical protein PBRA_009662 [Plasmodiophora brassicae]|uniref:Uncharacterized protein n=1 Tax=Plasmodiophora brassicae TaxID=37360 RepID=A0A0G4IJY4_PLABS|nr:hypothetical protein PBRA_009662 [Plasmodiophora brassicae]
MTSNVDRSIAGALAQGGVDWRTRWSTEGSMRSSSLPSTLLGSGTSPSSIEYEESESVSTSSPIASPGSGSSHSESPTGSSQSSPTSSRSAASCASLIRSRLAMSVADHYHRGRRPFTTDTYR